MSDDRARFIALAEEIIARIDENEGPAWWADVEPLTNQLERTRRKIGRPKWEFHGPEWPAFLIATIYRGVEPSGIAAESAAPFIKQPFEARPELAVCGFLLSRDPLIASGQPRILWGQCDGEAPHYYPADAQDAKNILRRWIRLYAAEPSASGALGEVTAKIRNEARIIADGARPTGLVKDDSLESLLGRAGNVFSLAEELRRAFRDEHQAQGRCGQIDAAGWRRHAPAFEQFCRAVLELQDAMRNPPQGFEAVAEQLLEAARVAREIRAAMETPHGRMEAAYLEFWPDLGSRAEDGHRAVSEARKALRAHDPFDFVDEPPLTLLERHPATPAGHLAFLEWVRKEISDAAEARRNQLVWSYPNATIESMVRGIKWAESRRRLEALSDLPADAVEQVARVLRRELAVGTVERIDELLKPALRGLCEAWEIRQNPAPKKREAEPEAKQGEGKPDADAPPAEEYIFRPDDDGWFLAGFGEGGHVRAIKGFGYLHRLVQTPTVPVPMAELVGADKDERIGEDRHNRQPMLDQKAQREIWEQMQALGADIEKANDHNDFGEAERLEREKEELLRHLQAATGIGGKSRDMNNPADKLRPSIHAAIKRACDKLRESRPTMEKLAEHFELSISSEGGTCFVYRPAGSVPPWRFGHPSEK